MLECKSDRHLVLYIRDGVLIWRCGDRTGSDPVQANGERYSGKKCAAIVDRVYNAVQATSFEWIS